MNREFIEQMFEAFASKDIEAVMAFFADDAVVFDPHYPITEMKGTAAIRQGFEWAFRNLLKPGFTIRHLWLTDDGGAVEVDTHHIFKGGMEVKFTQLFVIETRDRLLTRLQSYVPYRPPGIGGLLTRLTGVIWRLRGKRR